MQRQEAYKSLPFWLVLLALPLLTLVSYLVFDQPRQPVSIEQLSAEEPHFDSSTSSAETPAQAVFIAQKTEPIIENPVDEKEPVALDVESARAAVHQVENGVYERATALFEREAVDPAWANAYEQSLREMFSHHQGLQRVSVNSISCHATMCRIEVFTPRDADADYFTAMFYDALERYRDGELKGEAAIARRMEVGMTSVYVARKAHLLGFY